MASPLALVTSGIVGLAVLALIVLLAGGLLRSSPGPQALIAPGRPVPSGQASGRSVGPSTAPVKLDLWEDFQCPYCGEFTRTVEPGLISQYAVPGTVQITFHDLSFIGSGRTPDESNDAAVAARCAQAQGQFWLYMQYLYANQGTENSGTFTRALFDAIAARLGLASGPFDACLADPATLAAVRAESAQGTSLGITSTPSLFVDGALATNVLDLNALSATIDAAAQATSGPSGSPESPALRTSASPLPGAAAP
jgi:protein-disulfide isomerase